MVVGELVVVSSSSMVEVVEGRSLRLIMSSSCHPLVDKLPRRSMADGSALSRVQVIQGELRWMVAITHAMEPWYNGTQVVTVDQWWEVFAVSLTE